jgi:hypothetical protein
MPIHTITHRNIHQQTGKLLEANECAFYTTGADDTLCAGFFPVELPPHTFCNPLNEIHFSVYNGENVGFCVHHPMLGETVTGVNMALLSLVIIGSIGIYLLLKKLYRKCRQ